MLLLLSRRGSNVEVRAETLFLAALLGIDTIRAISMMGHSLQVFGSASLSGGCFLNLSTLKSRVRDCGIIDNTQREPFLMIRRLEEDTR